MTYEEKERVRRERWEKTQKNKAENLAKQEEFKANCWASKITKKVSPAVIKKIEEDEQNREAKQSAKIAKVEEEKKKKIEKNFVAIMQRKYGFVSEFKMPPVKLGTWPHDELYPEIVIPKGEFWYYRIFGKDDEKYDVNGVAKALRDNEYNKGLYYVYLKYNYSDEWLFKSEGSKDDCHYLHKMREKSRMILENSYYEQEERMREFMKEDKKRMEKEEEEEEEMLRKIKAGEISQRKYSKWMNTKRIAEMERDEEFDALGVEYGKALEAETRAMINKK